MKKITFILFFVLTTFSYSQKISNTLQQGIQNESRKFGFSLISGFSTPSDSFSNNSYASNGSFIEFTSSYYFSKFGIGISIGQFSNPTSSNLENFTNSLNFSTINSTEDWKVSYYGFGPEFTTSFNKIKASFLLRAGVMSVKPITLESSYARNVDVTIPIYSLETGETSKVSYFSTSFKIGYNISRNLNVFANINYLSALSNKFTITEKTIVDTNRNGTIDMEDFLKLDATSVTFDETITSIKPQSTNFGIGLSFEFGNSFSTIKRKRPGRTKYSNITLKRNQANDDGNDNNGTKAIDHNGSRSNTTATKIDFKGDGNGENTTRRGKRKAKKECLKNGGSFWESGDGSYHCMMPLSTAKAGMNTSNELFRSKKRKCFKAGGKWVTNSQGSFCWNPSSTSRVYGPGDAHYGHITVRKNKKQQAKVEVRGWDSKEKRINNSTKVINHDASRSNNTNSITADSKGDGNTENQQGYTKESTMIFVRVDETSLRKSNIKIPKDTFTQENDKRMSKRALRSRKRHGDKRYRERTKDRTLRSADKRYRERTKARTLRSADKRYRERTKARTLRSADKRYREKIRGYRMKNNKNTIQNDKPVKITTEGNNKVNPSTNLDARFLKAQNYQTIHIAKSKFQLTAPLIISKGKTELIKYNWTVKTSNKIK
ncbi:MAG: hypothetical protein JKY16_00920 [Lutibacter sp.]|nr:hypothetical protein [Lutibacter sp.]